jgi:hypothetical protein
MIRAKKYLMSLTRLEEEDMKNSYWLLVILSFVLLSACSSGNTNPPNNPPGNGGNTGTVASVTLIPEVNFNLGVGGKFRFVAVAKDASGKKLSVSVTWNSSDAAKASIDTAGQLEGLAPGTTQVTASAGGKTSAALTVTVVNNPSIESVDWSFAPIDVYADIYLDVGQKTTATATALDASAKPISGVTIAYYSENPEVATVDPNTGDITPVAPGSIVIGAAVAIAKFGIRSPIFLITSPSQVLTKICVQSSCNGTFTGSVGTFESAFALPFDAQDKEMNPNRFSFTWTSSNPAVVKFTPNAPGSNRGEFAYLAKGSSTITVSAGGVTGTLTINVP